MLSPKRALITGSQGQDGYYLSKFLKEKGYEVLGVDKDCEHDLSSLDSTTRLITDFRPDEIYNLAAFTHVGQSFKNPSECMKTNVYQATLLLETYMRLNKSGRFFQASSSSIYDLSSPYSVSKYAIHKVVELLRQKNNFFAVSGILFNHESPKRASIFLPQKVAMSAACAKLKIATSKELNEEGEPLFLNGKVKLGSLDSVRDWGYAGDYVEAMWLMLQAKSPVDYEIATGEEHSVRELCEIAFNYVGLDYKDYVETDQRFVRSGTDNIRKADIKPIQTDLGWKAKTKFKDLIEMMVEENLEKVK